MRHLPTALLLVFVTATSAFAELVLVRDGEPRAVIYTAAEPSESAERAAAELQTYVRKITGAELPIERFAGELNPAADRTIILVGDIPEAPIAIPDLPTGDDALHTREGYFLGTNDNGLVICVGNEGAHYRGTEYAVYELLERLGCRWFFPGEFGEVLPRTDTLAVPDDLIVRSRPSFVLRNIWMSGWADRSGDHQQWLLRNKGNPVRTGFAFPGDGTIHRLAPMEKYYEQYPELYAMQADGTRQTPQTPPHLRMIDTAHPMAVKIAADEIKAYFRENPETNSYGFSAPDGSPRSLSPEAVALDHGFMLDSGIGESISDGYFNFVNNVMHAVAEEFPDRYLIVLAYANRVRPPEGLDLPWHDNIIIQLARLRIDTLKAIGDEGTVHARRHARTLRGWARMCDNLLIYDYDPHADLSRMPNWRIGAIGPDMRFYKDHNVIGFTTEGHNTFLRTGPNYYLRAKLMWDVDADVDALLDDFYAKFFEGAAAPMKRFHEEIDRMRAQTIDGMTWTPLILDWTAIYPPDETAALGDLLDEAESLATTDAVRTRLAAYRALHDYMMAHHRLFGLLRDGRPRDAAAQLPKLREAVARVEAIQPGLLPPDPGWVINSQSGMGALETYLGLLTQRVGGDETTTRLLGMAPRMGTFRPDPHDIGLFEQWQRADYNPLAPAAMRAPTDDQAPPAAPIDLTYAWDLQGYRDDQGHRFDEFGWYFIPIELRPAEAERGPAQLVAPHVAADRVWIWINGHLVYSPADLAQQDEPMATGPGRPFVLGRRGRLFIQCNVEKWIRPGTNVITMRTIGSNTRLQHHGVLARPLVFQPSR